MHPNDTEIAPGIETFVLADDGTFPNSHLPVVLYRQGIALAPNKPAASIEERYHDQGWDGTWRNGIYSFHHYHSTAHEVLGIASGTVRVQLGGPDGKALELEAGDVVILPAGVAHRNLGGSDDLVVVGAYPPGQQWDLLKGGPNDRPEADRNIAQVPLPQTDPVLGDHGPLISLWQDASNQQE